MDKDIRNNLIRCYTDNLTPPYSGSIDAWCHENCDLPSAYAIPGRFSVESSPYLVQPFRDLKDPSVKMVLLIGATQIGKTLISELYIPYIVVNDPGPILRLHASDEMAALFTETRLIPLLKNCKPVNSMLKMNRFAASKKGISLPHMYIKVGSAKESLLHGQSIKYLLMDEAHIFDLGVIEKALARTTAFAGRRKVVISSQPNSRGSELEKYYNAGLIWSWHWLCPSCHKHQEYRWWHRREDDSYSGVNWTTILNDDGETTNISLSSKTAWLECEYCRHHVEDTLENRRYLNDSGQYICIKTDGDPSIHSYTTPQFVNINIKFSELVAQFINARRRERMGLDEDMISFKNQVLGAFYKASPQEDASKIARGEYVINPSAYDKEWVRIMTCDFQAKGGLKFYVIREWNKNGNESRRLSFGVERTWEEINEIRKKWGIRTPNVGVDSGFSAVEVYQTCLKFGEDFYDPVLKKKIYLTWVCMKGDGAKLSYMHEDKVSRYFAPLSKQDAMFPVDSKFHGRPAKLLLWSNYSIKSILITQLRDGKLKNVKWLVDKKDADYEKQLYSEMLKEEIDKKSGAKKLRWVKIGDEANEYLDCEAMNLTLAIRYSLFSPVAVDEPELQKVVPQAPTSV